MGDHHDAQLATSALQMALQHQHPPAGLILHSDRSSEFANARFHQQANEARIHLSMSAKGNCFDNAVAESFFATLKLEAVQGQVYNPNKQPVNICLISLKCFITVNDCTPALITVALSSAPLRLHLLLKTGGRPKIVSGCLISIVVQGQFMEHSKLKGVTLVILTDETVPCLQLHAATRTLHRPLRDRQNPIH